MLRSCSTKLPTTKDGFLFNVRISLFKLISFYSKEEVTTEVNGSLPVAVSNDSGIQSDVTSNTAENPQSSNEKVLPVVKFML